MDMDVHLNAAAVSSAKDIRMEIRLQVSNLLADRQTIRANAVAYFRSSIDDHR